MSLALGGFSGRKLPQSLVRDWCKCKNVGSEHVNRYTNSKAYGKYIFSNG